MDDYVLVTIVGGGCDFHLQSRELWVIFNLDLMAG